MRINEKLVMFTLFALAVSICAGSFFEVFMTGEGKQQLESALESVLNSDTSGSASFGACFLKTLGRNALVLLLALISPAVIITLPVLPVFILAQGLSIGFSAAMTLEVAGLKGIVYILTALLPQNLIRLPVYCVLSAVSIEAGFHSAVYAMKAAARGRARAAVSGVRSRRRNALQLDARRYFFIFAAGFVLIILSCLLEAFLVSMV